MLLNNLNDTNSQIKEFTDLISVLKTENDELKSIIKSLNDRSNTTAIKYENEIKSLKNELQYRSSDESKKVIFLEQSLKEMTEKNEKRVRSLEGEINELMKLTASNQHKR